MQFKDIVYGLGDFLEWTFGILPLLHNIPNLIFLVVMFVLFFYWMGRMTRYKKMGDA